MKLKYFSLLSFLFCALLFTSCEQEQALTGTTAEPLSEMQIAKNYLLRTPNLVLFAALEINHTTHLVTGYLIDKNSNLRKVEAKNFVAHQFDDAFMSDDAMRTLYDNSIVIDEISPLESAAFNRKSSLLKSEETDTKENEDLNISKVYIGFKRNNANESESCSPGSYDHGPTHYQLLIDAKGRLSGTNSGSVTKELLTWLTSLEEAQEV